MPLLGSQEAGQGSIELAAGVDSPGGGGEGGAFPGFGTGAPGPTALGTAGTAATARRSDQAPAAYRSDLPLSTTWFIDPVSGVDTAAGTSSGTALKTLQQLKQRWWGAEITANTTVTILGNIPGTDTGSWNFTIAPGFRVTFVGSLGPTTGFGGRAIDNTIYSGTVTTFTNATDAPGNNDVEIVDSTLPVSFTASGLMASGVLFKRTNSTPKYWNALLDKGSKTARITSPQGSTLANTFAASTLTNGDSYSCFAMWQWPTQNFGQAVTGTGTTDAAGTTPLVLQELYDNGTTVPQLQAAGMGVTPNRVRVWYGFRSRCNLGTVASNCMFEIPTAQTMTFAAQTDLPTQIQGGGMKGSGASIAVFFGVIGVGAAPLCIEGVQLAPNDGSFLTMQVPWNQSDCTIPCLAPTNAARVGVSISTAGAGMSGTGNTSKFVSCTNSAAFAYDYNGAAPPFASASSSDGSPIQIGGTSFAVSALPAIAGTVLAPTAQPPLAATNFLIPVVVETPVIDLTATGVTSFVMPLQASRKFVIIAARLYILTRDAALTTAPSLTFQQNGSAINASQATSTASINSFAAPANASLSSAFIQAPDMTSFPISVNITVGGAGTGLTTFTGKVVLIGYYE